MILAAMLDMMITAVGGCCLIYFLGNWARS